MAIKYAVEPPKEVPASLNVYSLAPPQSTTKYVTSLSQRFGLTGKLREVVTSKDWTSYLEGRYRVSVHRNSGAVWYVNRDKYSMEPEKDFSLKPQQSEKVAQAFLERSQFLPTKEMRLHKITHLRSATSDLKGRDKVERLIDAGVIYRRFVDETPVQGPGGFAMVHIDPEAEVVGLRSVWRTALQSAAKVKIMPAGAAIETFEKLASKVQGDVTVTAANFGYFEQGDMDKQAYLEPAYVFIYTAQNGEVAHKSIEVISAGLQTFAKLKGGKRFPAGAQTKRTAG